MRYLRYDFSASAGPLSYSGGPKYLLGMFKTFLYTIGLLLLSFVYLTVEMGDVSIGPLVPSASSMVLLVLLEGHLC